MPAYDMLATYYDDFVNDPKAKSDWLQQQIAKHNPTCIEILELACGTGTILAHLKQHADYRVTGLDLASEMLKVAEQKLPEGTFIKGDMSDFQLGKKFNVALCLYDSINHLLQFEQWQSLFSHVSQHLNNGGLFIFDMNSKEMLEGLTEDKPYISKIDSTRIEMTSHKDEARPAFKIKIYKDNKLVGEEYIPETSFDLSEVETSLQKDFKILERVEPDETIPPYDTGKIYYICQKQS